MIRFRWCVCFFSVFLKEKKSRKKNCWIDEKKKKLLSEKQRNWFDTFNPIINGWKKSESKSREAMRTHCSKMPKDSPVYIKLDSIPNHWIGILKIQVIFYTQYPTNLGWVRLNFVPRVEQRCCSTSVASDWKSIELAQANPRRIFIQFL